MHIYDAYAAVYDDSGQIGFSLQMVPYLGGLFTRHPVERGACLDLACGTGTIALAMAREGWRVFGVDISEQMLQIARRKQEEDELATGDRLDITWSCQDMRQVTLPQKVSLATCLYDSLNYMLSSEDLSAVFQRVAGLLRPGGLFLFDMNTAYALATHWDDQTYVTDTPDLTVIMESNHHPERQRTTVRVICFQRVGDQYRKIAEEHTEQAYPREHVATLLTDAGFTIEGTYNCFTFNPPGATSPRIMWAARKPGQAS